jgi:hypothetical protein
MRFEWDPAKDLANQTKHGLSFEQASKLFEESVDLLELYDEEHSDDEDRFIGVGNTPSGTIVVVFMEPSEDVVRILSARPATRREQAKLEAYWRGKND